MSSTSLKASENEGEGEGEEMSEEDEAEGSFTDQFRQMSIYLGASRGSADNFLKTARTLSGVQGDDGTLDHAPLLYDPCALPSRRPVANVHIPLPPIDIARQYFAAQHMYIGTIFSFTDAETFERHLKEIYYADEQDMRSAQTSLTYAKFLSILAMGRLYSVNQRSAGGGAGRATAEDNPPGLQYFAQALALLPDVHEECSMLGVETLAYVGYFLQNLNRRDAAFLYIGIALRMAITLGLHQEVAEPCGHLSEAAREHRRRVWWSIYSLDRILTLKSGNPLSILDADVGVRPPSRLAGEPEDSPVVVLRHYTELSRILGDITTLIYRRTAAHTGQSLVAAVHSILVALSRWEDGVPKSLRVDLDRRPPLSPLSRESISLFLHYYQCIHMTARPLLFHVVQQRLSQIRTSPSARDEKERDWHAGLSKKTAAVICGCITAARKTLRIMSTAAEYGMVATFGYMDCEHAFSAAIVLVLVCGTFPADAGNSEALRLGLGLLRRIGALGNGHVADRHWLLVHLQSILSLEARAEQAVSQNSMTPASVAFAGASDRPQPSPAETVQDPSFFNFDFVVMETTDVLADNGTSMTTDEADNSLWEVAFANGDFDFSQLIPETDLNDYGL